MPNTQTRLPVLSAPINRDPGAATLSDGGMEPSGWFDDIIKTVGPAIPGVLSAFGV
jgi:hypothetical protein